MIQTLEWTDKGVRFIDQTKLPTEETYVTCTAHEQVADVIRSMVVRGAPAIGVAAAASSDAPRWHLQGGSCLLSTVGSFAQQPEFTPQLCLKFRNRR